MAKKNNEAKITFTAATGEFNKAIKESNDEMSKLRAEMRLNAEQMKTTGETAEGLEKSIKTYLISLQSHRIRPKHCHRSLTKRKKYSAIIPKKRKSLKLSS